MELKFARERKPEKMLGIERGKREGGDRIRRHDRRGGAEAEHTVLATERGVGPDLVVGAEVNVVVALVDLLIERGRDHARQIDGLRVRVVAEERELIVVVELHAQTDMCDVVVDAGGIQVIVIGAVKRVGEPLFGFPDQAYLRDREIIIGRQAERRLIVYERLEAVDQEAVNAVVGIAKRVVYYAAREIGDVVRQLEKALGR